MKTLIPSIVAVLALSNCTLFNKLSPEQQADIERKAIAAATAAATTAAQGALDGKTVKQITVNAGKAALEAVKNSEAPTP